ncbi:MAG: hypothetical protein ACK4UN_16060, partial [Limisphaerales bacterium]
MNAFFGMICFGLLLLTSFGSNAWAGARFTEVINDVRVQETTGESRRVTPNQTYLERDVIRTGVASRTELRAADQSITRIGASTICSFDRSARIVHLEQGSLLFQSAKEKSRITI